MSRCATAVALKCAQQEFDFSDPFSPNQWKNSKTNSIKRNMSLCIPKHHHLTRFSRLAAVLQISISTLSALRTLDYITELLAVAWHRFRAESEPAHPHCCFFLFNFVSSKASKQAGQALVGKAASPPFESQHHHLLHCLEKTTVTFFFSFFLSLSIKYFSLYERKKVPLMQNCIIAAVCAASSVMPHRVTNTNKVSFFMHAQTVELS